MASGTEAVLEILRADPSAIEMMDTLSRARLLQIVGRNLDKDSALFILGGLVSLGILETVDEDDLFEAANKKFLRDRSPSGHYRAIRKISWPKLTEAFFDQVVSKCGSGTWDIANSSIDLIQSLSDEDATCLTEKQLADYVVNLASVSTGQYPSKSAKAILNNGLGSRTNASTALCATVALEKNEFFRKQTEWGAVGQIIDRSGPSSNIVSVFSSMPADEMTGSLRDFLSGHRDEEVKDLVSLIASNVSSDPEDHPGIWD